MNPLLLAFFLSMTPVGELRLGIPVALAAKINPWLALVVCVAGNTIIIPIVFFFLEVLHKKFMHIKFYQSAFDKFMERTRKKTAPLLDKYGMIGLAIFVAVPIPGTGAYTGTVAAWFFGMNKWKAFLSIFAGVIVAGLIMLSVTVGGMKLFSVI